MKTKITFKCDKSLKDRMFVELLTLGPLTVYLVYERVVRVCSYCVIVGHEISGCPKRGRVLQLCADPLYANRPEMLFMRDHRMGPWINCPHLVPRPLPVSVNSSFNPNHYYPNPNRHPSHSYMLNPNMQQPTPTYEPPQAQDNQAENNRDNLDLEPTPTMHFSNPNKASPFHAASTTFSAARPSYCSPSTSPHQLR